jgi:hypothetical protein
VQSAHGFECSWFPVCTAAIPDQIGLEANVHRYSCSTRGFHPSQILSSYSERAPRFSLQQCRETSYSGSENASSFDQKSIINDDIKTINELVNNDPIIMKD